MDELKKNRTFIVVLFICFLCNAFLGSTNIFAVTNASISLNLSSLSTLDLIAGSFSSVSQTVAVNTDNYTGYTVKLTNSANTTSMINTSDNTLTIPTITLPSGSESVTANDFTNGYGISTDGLNYIPAPGAASSITIGGSSSAGTGSHTLTFGARPAPETSAGHYIKSFVITAVVNDPQYSITYNANTTDTVSNMPSNISTTTSNTGTVDISSTTPTRASYTFLGWDEDSTVTSNPTYAPGDTITLEPTQANGITLYAIWEIASGDVVEEVTNPDGSVTVTTTTYVNGEPSEKTIATTDTSGNVSTQEITYVNGTEVVTGYTIDTSDNPNGVLELDGTDSIDTGVIAFDGNDFTISLTAIFNTNDISGTANPVVAFRDYTDGGCMVNIHNSSVRWMNEDNTSSPTTGTTLSFGFTKYTGGSSTSGSYYFRWINKYNNYYWTYGTGTTEKKLKIIIQSTSSIISAYIYDENNNLVAQPATTSTLPMTFDFSTASLDDITIVLGYFDNNGTDRYTKFDIVDFSAEKTLSSS